MGHASGCEFGKCNCGEANAAAIPPAEIYYHVYPSRDGFTLRGTSVSIGDKVWVEYPGSGVKLGGPVFRVSEYGFTVGTRGDLWSVTCDPALPAFKKFRLKIAERAPRIPDEPVSIDIVKDRFGLAWIRERGMWYGHCHSIGENPMRWNTLWASNGPLTSPSSWSTVK